MNPTTDLFTRIAQTHLGIPTLTERKSDSLDFHTVAVWGIDAALQAAFDVGRRAGVANPSDGDHVLDSPDIDELLAARRQVAVLWSVEDVRGLRSDLNDDQAWDVLRFAREHHDASFGLNWDTLAFAAERLYGEAPQPAELDDEDA